MTIPVWPSSLPTPLVDGVTYAPQSNNVIRSQFAGGSKSRRRFTSSYEDVSFRLLLNRAGMQVLSDLVIYTLADVLPMQWVEFRDPARRPAIYAFKQRPTFTPAGCGWLWYADIQLELRTPFNCTFPLTDELGAQLATDTDEGLTT